MNRKRTKGSEGVAPELVSIIIPCFNQAEFLPESLESSLRQTHQNIEVIVVDDGSPDDVAGTVAKFLKDSRLRLITESNQGLAAARNNGAKAARGKYLQFLDADDLIQRDKVTLQLKEFQTRRDLGIVYCNYDEHFLEHDLRHEVNLEQEGFDPAMHFRSLWGRMLFPPCVPLVSRQWFDRIGGFNAQFQICADLDFWLRLAQEGCKAALVPKVLATYRKHGASMTQTAPSGAVWKEFEQLLQARLERAPKQSIVEASVACGTLNRLNQRTLWDLLIARKELRSAQQTVVSHAAQSAAAATEYKRLQRRYTRERADARKAARAAAEHVANANTYIAALETAVAKTTAEYTQAADRHEEAARDAKRYVADVRRELDKATAHARGLESEISKLRTNTQHDVEALERQVRESSSYVETLEAEICKVKTDSASQREALEREFAKASRFASSLEAEVDKLNAAVAELTQLRESDHLGWKREAQALQSELAATTAEYWKLDTLYRESEQKSSEYIASLQSAVGETNSDASRLEAKLLDREPVVPTPEAAHDDGTLVESRIR